MKKILFILAILVIVVVVFWTNRPAKIEDTTKTSITETKENPKTEIVAQGLEVPWALAFLPDGRLLVTERKGQVKLIDKGEVKNIATLNNVLANTESGLHGITIHPDFNSNKYVYLYYTYGDLNQNSMNRVSRFTFDEQVLNDEKVVVDKIPGAFIHDGGRIKFGPDKFLYISTGDAVNSSLSQDKNSLAGKILRVTDEGKPAPDNPFGNEVYSFGHRNPQGITWDKDGKLWISEHGSSAFDEINLVVIGKNYGWPNFRGDDLTQGVEKPVTHSGNSTWAPAGAAYFNGSIFFAGLRGQALFEAKLDNNNISKVKEHFKGEFGRIRDVVLGPDNRLYITTSNRDGRGSPLVDDDKIIKINP